MRKNLGAKPIIYPMPVLIIAAYDEKGKVNLMNAAWGTACDMNQIAVVITKSHKTTQNILKTGEFSVSMATVSEVIPADYVGIVSGNDQPDKFKKTGWTEEKSAFVNAPLIKELPLALECKMVSYDFDSEILIGEIVNVSADEGIMTDGKIDLDKFRPVCYDPFNHAYMTLGERVGKAFSDGKKLK